MMAGAMKMPDPIIDPTMIVVAEKTPRWRSSFDMSGGSYTPTSLPNLERRDEHLIAFGVRRRLPAILEVHARAAVADLPEAHPDLVRLAVGVLGDPERHHVT